MSVKPEIKERLAERLQVMKEAKTPGELAYTIWTKEFEKATSTSKQDYRNCFVEWIAAYKENRKPNLWNRYKNPNEVADAIWQPFLDQDESDKLWFNSLRSGLIEWINTYCGQ